MTHLPPLIQDLGVILITAGFTTLLFRAWRQPVVLGYLLAGFLVSKNVPFLPSVEDTGGIKVWAEIGVIFLLFGLGLEFSFRKLMKVGKSASITAVVEVVFMVGLGYLTGRALGWNSMDSLFLGGILSISSTTIIIRALEELGMKGRGFVSLVFAILIVEDLVAILLMVLLSTLASAGGAFSGLGILYSAGRLLFFLLLWFVAGTYFLPTLLYRARRYLNDETMMVGAIGLCLAMVMFATHLGFSPALGAFVMGSLFAETKEGKRVDELMHPVRNLFAAIFFVSVGMLIEPSSLVQNWQVIALITVITIVGKLVSTSIGALISGESLKHSVQSGLSLAQIGEFSFIIATLGLTLGVTSSFLYPVAVAVSAITTLTTPFLIRASDPFYSWLERRLSPRILENLQAYQNIFLVKQNVGMMGRIWQQCGFLILFNSVVIIAFLVSVKAFLAPFIFEHFGDGAFVQATTAIGTLILCLPFFSAIFRSKNGAALIRYVAGLILLGILVGQFTGFTGATVYMLIWLPLLIFLWNRHASSIYRKIENRFLRNLTAADSKKTDRRHQIAPWDAALVMITVSAHSEFVAKSLAQSPLRDRFGVMVALIERAGKTIFAPGGDEILLPGDRLGLIGTDEQIARITPALDTPPIVESADSADYRLEPVLLGSRSPFLQKSLRESGLREATGGIVVGLERDGERNLNPDPNVLLQPGDLLWVVGDRKKILSMRI